MIPARRPLAALVAAALVVVCVAMLATTSGAGASTSDDLDAARQQLAAARAAANETAAQFTAADHQLEETREHITKLRETVTSTKARIAELRAYTRQRAVYAYTHPSASLDILVDATGTADAARRQQLLDQANQTDNGVARRLATLTDQLKVQQHDLEQQEHAQEQLSDQLDAKLTALRADQANVEQAVATLSARLDAELAVVRYVDARRQAELEAERAALAAPQTISSNGPGQILATPTAGAFQCPVAGAAYSDDYGGATGHPGIDMFVPTGTAAVAVMAGTVRYVPNEGAGGNTAYLQAEDGNTYFYAHFSSFVGQGRQVAQGEVIGLTGMTGNATAPHLHFEVRIGGDNGSTTDPYPMLNAAGC